MTPDKVIQRPLESGKWKVGVKPGMDVIGVSLIGMRNRPYALAKLSKEEFQSRCMRGPSGEFEDSVVTRGTPHWYYYDGQSVYLNPSPAHSWTINIELKERVRA